MGRLGVGEEENIKTTLKKQKKKTGNIGRVGVREIENKKTHKKQTNKTTLKKTAKKTWQHRESGSRRSRRWEA